MLEITQRKVPDASVPVPGSKSLTNRGLAIGALARGETVLTGALVCEDTLRLVEAVRSLGLEVAVDEARSEVRVSGGDGSFPVRRAYLDVGASGTALRFLTAMTALASGSFVIDGTPRLQRRPVGSLCAALRALGAEIYATGAGGAPVVSQPGNLAGGRVTVPADVSSQFTSALLLIGPCLPGGLSVRMTGRAVSAPYLDMTEDIMTAFGARVLRPAEDRVAADGGGYAGRSYAIEGDATAASYLFAAAAVTGGRVRVTNLPESSRQGDLKILAVLEEMGATVERTPEGPEVRGPVTRGVDVDLRDAPDLVPTVAAVGMTVEGQTVIRGVPHLRVKESDRIETTVEAVRALGGVASKREDGLVVEGGTVTGGEVDPVGDHRIAMAFSVLGLATSGVRILNPGCVAKSFPCFFDVLGGLPEHA